MAGEGRPQNEDGDSCSGSLPQPHPEIEQRRKAELVEQPPVPAFGREMRRHRMRQPSRIELLQRSRGGCGDETIEEYRDAAVPSGKDAAKDGRKLAAAEY